MCRQQFADSHRLAHCSHTRSHKTSFRNCESHARCQVTFEPSTNSIMYSNLWKKILLNYVPLMCSPSAHWVQPLRIPNRHHYRGQCDLRLWSCSHYAPSRAGWLLLFLLRVLSRVLLRVLLGNYIRNSNSFSIAQFAPSWIFARLACFIKRLCVSDAMQFRRKASAHLIPEAGYRIR